jgi:hypothetical protein
LTTADGRSTRPAPAPGPGRPGRAAGWTLEGPLATALTAAYLLLLAAWVPHYLTWPLWNDLDHFATFAMAWDAGLRPYRDLPSFQCPGEYYLFWVVGKLCGWGRTGPIYAADASLLIALGIVMSAWSRLRAGRVLPGLVGYGVFLCYYLNLGYDLAAQRDWHAAFFAVLSLFIIEVGPGRVGRLASAPALALALAIRPQIVLLIPAFVLALDESARAPTESWGRTGKAVLEWAAVLAACLVLAFAPLIAAGLLDDFAGGLRVTAVGGNYNRLTLSSLSAGMEEQFWGHSRLLVVPAAVAVLATTSVPGRMRMALPWLVAMAGAWFYKPLSPVPHGYLIHLFVLVGSVNIALLARLILETPAWTPALRLTAILVVLGFEIPNRPIYVRPSRSLEALFDKRGGMPVREPLCGPWRVYPWDDYRAMIAYLRREVPTDFRIANALSGLPAVTGPVARLPAFPGESLAWFQYFKQSPELEASYLKALRDSPRSVVVWSPAEKDSRQAIIPGRMISFIESAYWPEARFGAIEVWRRKHQTSADGRH